MIEQELKEELVISETKGSELIAFLTDYRPILRLEFVKPRGKDPLPDLTLNIEEFISVKGIKALGNQVTTDKIKQVHIENSLPFVQAETDEDEIDESKNEDSNDDGDEQNNEGKLTLF